MHGLYVSYTCTSACNLITHVSGEIYKRYSIPCFLTTFVRALIIQNFN